MNGGGRIAGGSAVLIVAALAFASVAGGAQERRGGNHNCDGDKGTFYSSHFYAAGDNITVGFRTNQIDFPPSSQDVVRTQNTEEGTDTRSSMTCGVDQGTFKRFTSRLGPGGDSVRLDAKGMVDTETWTKLPAAIKGVLIGGGGGDTLRGHKGANTFRGGAGDDVIKAHDGRRDVVKCGPGEDKADVDRHDQVKGCEKQT